MLATLNTTVRPVLARSACSGISKRIRYVSRPLVTNVFAFKEDEKQQQQQQRRDGNKEERQLQRRDDRGSALRRADPYTSFNRLPSIFQEMQREMDALTRAFGVGSMWDDDFFMQPFRGPLGDIIKSDLPAMRLATDIHEDEKQYIIKADIPGMSKEDIKIQLGDNVLTISGERKEEHIETDTSEAESETGKERKPSRVERRFGSFVRSFMLPKHVDPDGIKATAKDGVLTVCVPKKLEAEPKPKEIPVA